MRGLFTLLVALFFSPFIAFGALAQGDGDDDLCRVLADYEVAAGVEHVGDADVPADINPLNGGMGAVHIPITIDLATRFGLSLPPALELQPDVAVITVHGDGRVLYNGQDLSADFTDICAQKSLENRADGNGQDALDGLGSSPVVK